MSAQDRNEMNACCTSANLTGWRNYMDGVAGLKCAVCGEKYTERWLDDVAHGFIRVKHRNDLCGIRCDQYIVSLWHQPPADTLGAA